MTARDALAELRELFGTAPDADLAAIVDVARLRLVRRGLERLTASFALLAAVDPGMAAGLAELEAAAMPGMRDVVAEHRAQVELEIARKLRGDALVAGRLPTA